MYSNIELCHPGGLQVANSPGIEHTHVLDKQQCSLDGMSAEPCTFSLPIRVLQFPFFACELDVDSATCWVAMARSKSNGRWFRLSRSRIEQAG
jgi:hypothetical protein